MVHGEQKAGKSWPRELLAASAVSALVLTLDDAAQAKCSQQPF